MIRDNGDDIDRAAHDDVLAPALRGQLAALRQDVAPRRDLWPAIAARLAQAPAHVPARRAARSRAAAPRLPYALAASLLVAAVVGWQLLPRPAIDSTAGVAARDAPLLRTADAMAREYEGALRELDAARATGVTAPAAAARAELDRSAQEVRSALEHAPDAVFLVRRLQRIHAQRLALARRLA